MHNTKAVEVNIQATSPLFGVGAGAAAADAVSGALAASADGAAAVSFFCSAAGACARDTVGATAPRANAATDASAMIHFFIVFFSSPGLERFFAGLAGADAHDLLEVVDEYLAVADLAGTGRTFDRLDRSLDDIVADRCLDLDLRQKIDHVLGTSIQLGVPLLPAETLDLGHRHALYANGGQCLADLVELERLDDRSDEFHGVPCV